MALMNSCALPARDSSKSFSSASVAGCLRFIHSRMGQVSRTRVFTFALLLPEGSELFHQVGHVSGSALKLSPGITFGKNNFLPPNFQGQLGALGEIESVANLLRYGDLPLGGYRNLIHKRILPYVSQAARRRDLACLGTLRANAE